MFGGNMQRRIFCVPLLKSFFESMSEFNKMQTVKRRMFAMRNGIIADSLRKAGSPFRMIFGLNLPQLDEIAADTGKDEELALMLFADRNNRESSLLAPMIMPEQCMTPELALGLPAANVSRQPTLCATSCCASSPLPPPWRAPLLKETRIWFVTAAYDCFGICCRHPLRK